MKRVVLVNIKNGYEIRDRKRYRLEQVIPDAVFSLKEGENGHFLIFYQQRWPNLKWHTLKFTGKVAHSREEGLDKAHAYALEVLEKNYKENTDYEFEDRTADFAPL